MIKRLLQLAHNMSGMINILPPRVASMFYTRGRKWFMHDFHQLAPLNPPIVIPPTNLSRKLWGIEFRLPLFNAAGMFKNGESYDMVASIGAGGYLGGTSTYNMRSGNTKFGMNQPFITLPHSGMAVNFLGLPNLGDEALAGKVITTHKVPGCPIGWSVMRSPDFNLRDGMSHLIKSLHLFAANPLIDFIEINESCPNVGADFSGLEDRLSYIAAEFLTKRARVLPVIIKLANDLTPDKLSLLIAMLIKYGFDGLNIGNTSTNYTAALAEVSARERELYTWFTHNIGGGVSGRCLKKQSLELCAQAVEDVRKLNPNHEFHIIRTGGIDSYNDLIESQQAGIMLNQWYSGFFTRYIEVGSNVYQNLFP